MRGNNDPFINQRIQAKISDARHGGNISLVHGGASHDTVVVVANGAAVGHGAIGADNPGGQRERLLICRHIQSLSDAASYELGQRRRQRVLSVSLWEMAWALVSALALVSLQTAPASRRANAFRSGQGIPSDLSSYQLAGW